MFRNLKFKLTLLNVAVICVILFLFGSVTYSLKQWELDMHSRQVMRILANQIGSKAPAPAHGAKPRRRPYQYFYAKADNHGNITATSGSLHITREDLNGMIHTVFKYPADHGIIHLDHQSFRFIKTVDKNTGETVLIFIDDEFQDKILDNLMIIMAAIGFIALLLAFFGGLFVAERALIPIRASWQRQKDFVTDASHEMRTPLAVIQTNLDLVLGNPEETVESQYRWLKNIQNESRRMAKMVDDLLFLARADSDQKLLEIKRFPLHSALREALEPFEAMAAGKDITLESSIDQDIEFLGDELRIKQVVVILLDNAIKCTPQGGRVEFRVANRDKTVEITVSDTGVGIEQKDLDKIFERFYRADKSRTRAGGGSGLGLSIAHWIVTEHKGTIKVSSGPGKGATFKVILPKQ